MRILSLKELDRLQPKKFEEFVFDVFEKHFKGNEIKLIHTQYQKDGGKDAYGIENLLIADYNISNSFWVEAKKRNKNINLSDIGKTLVLVLVNSIHSIF